ncbi:ribosomal RNA processing protein 1 homolog B isoform X2 [Salmo salar]|uniref:Ribosomal RNA processing protein 1 homolog B isoform X2 n=1 Tax=Salmo salar TaxID=8030 RepID=A0A1S3NX36_SALSA|nr:ribosomal RNA processing protein 1 homolog B-like isoform X2 [Salmo salar]|eukprot:XP_014019811.1 PREDICTED: ribosomal RNA processing protein 1 homolog B-like isoform X2 [Salmo salar]
MAPIQQEAEIQFAQRLASNEKPMRTKAIKKLRKYISVRSQKVNGGFTGDELLKLWKGLFYCLWMQDKPLLQEELSNQISGLMHSFQNVQSMFLFLETFLQTIKREWTGIDRLRMDKFFQLVRFVFRNSFEMMKRKEWETSVVTRFLELLTAQILHSTSGAPCGLQFHILDLYTTELAAVGSAELTAAQNLTFIDPFCKTASKTKDRILLKAICGSIFSAIVDQAPFAIEDLLKEVNATGGGSEESDSGQASEEEEEKKEPPKKAVKKSPMKTTGKQTNCTVSTEEDEDGLEDEDEMFHLESDSESEIPDDGGIGPVLQFDYSALADRLFGLASRSNTPSHNRQRLYKVIKTLRDLSDGVFPQDEYPEEVSTDEDDDEMFGSRKRMKRGRALEEEESSPPKKRKGKKNDSKPGKSDQRAASDKSKPAKTPGDTTTRKKRSMGEVKSDEQNRVTEELKVKAQADTTTTTESETTDAKKAAPTEAKTELSATIDSVEAGEKGVKKETSTTAERTDVGVKLEAILEEDASPMKVTDTPTEVTAVATEVQSETPQDVVVGSLSSAMEMGQKAQSETPVPDSTSSKKKKKTKKSKTPVQEEGEAVAEPETNTDVPETSVKATETEDQLAPATQDGEGATEPESAPETATTSTTKRKGRRKSTKQVPEEQTTVEEVETKPDAVEEIMATPLKKTRRMKAEQSLESTKEEVAETDSAPVDTTPAGPKPLATPAEEPPADVHIATTFLKKKKLKAAKSEEESVEVEGEMQPETEADVILVVAETVPAEVATPILLKKKKKKTAKAEEQSVEAEGKIKTAADSNRTLVDAEAELVEVSTPAPLKKKKKKAAPVSEEQEPDTTAVEESIAEEQPAKVDLETPVKKRKIPVVIEVEAEELEAEAEAARVNDSKEPSTPVNAKKTKKMMLKKAKGGEESDFITLQNHATIPTPIFFKRAKGSPSTSLSSKKKCQTPKSESKKVTFGLNKNKTAEFRKTDRSLLVSPEGSSRVPFDPQQKPLFGVLKSPMASLTNITKKKTKSTPKATPKRPTAADFF